jgi:hypothetical protein
VGETEEDAKILANHERPPASPGRQPNCENWKYASCCSFVLPKRIVATILVPLRLVLLFSGCDQAPLRGQQP